VVGVDVGGTIVSVAVGSGVFVGLGTTVGASVGNGASEGVALGGGTVGATVASTTVGVELPVQPAIRDIMTKMESSESGRAMVISFMAGCFCDAHADFACGWCIGASCQIPNIKL